MIKKLLVSIVNFGKETRYTFNDGTMKWVVHNNDKSKHRKYTTFYEDLCQ